MHFTRDTSRGQVAVLTFMQGDVAASQTDVQITLAETIGSAAAHSTLAVDSYVAPWDFEVIAVAGTLDAAATAGSLTVGATINGTEDSDSTSTITTGTEFRKRIPRGAMRGVAGDNIGVEITTDASWNGTTSDLAVQVYVLYAIEGV